MNAQKQGLGYNIRKNRNDDVPEITLKDLEQFHNSNVKNTLNTLLFSVMKEKIDFNIHANYCKVRNLSLDELFGY